MNADLQSLVAPLVVIIAVSYLTHRWWKRRNSSGCDTDSGCGACPKPKKSDLPSPKAP